MKPILSWLLLCLVSFHWIGGHVYFRVINIQQIKHLMSETEEAIAYSIEKETGIQTEIEVINNDIIEEIGYSGVFVFSKKINGKLYQYTIQTQPHLETKEQFVNSQTNFPNDFQHKIFDKLFPKLFNQPEPIQPFFAIKSQNLSVHRQVKPMKSLFHLSIPLPPPNQSI